MLEIALEITFCLLIAAVIGFGLGYITSELRNKKYTKKGQPLIKKESIEKEIDVNEETFFENLASEEIEIPTSNITQNAVEVLKNLDDTGDIAVQKPETLDVPRNNVKDALTQIKGIGEKVEAELNTAGIYHFSQIANWNEANMQWLETNTTFANRAKKYFWVNQAKSLIS